MSAQIDAAFNYNDLQGLESLKAGARKDSPEALKAVAQQFESMFLSLIMKSMRDATDVLASDLENSYQTKFYRDMNDQQMSLSLSQNGGFGLADVLYEQLAETQNPTRFDPFNIDVKSMDESIRSILPAQHSNLGIDDTQALIDSLLNLESPLDFTKVLDKNPDTEPDLAGLGMAVGDPTLSGSKDKTQVYSSPTEFIQSLWPVAEQAADSLGLNPKILVAQAALETGWGTAVIEKEDGQPSFNFFGIKADQRWQGDAATTITHEFIAGRQMTIKAPFRAYQNAEESFNDYVNFISGSERYQAALHNADNPETYVKELQKAGYATDPNYADKILHIANSDWFEQV